MASRRRQSGAKIGAEGNVLATISRGARGLVSRTELPFSNTQMKLCFKAFAKVNSGREDMQLDSFVALKPTTARGELSVAFGLIDQDRDGSIIVEEFMSGLSLMCEGTEHERLSFLLHLYDADSSRELGREDIDKILDDLNKKKCTLSTGSAQPRTSESRDSLYAEMVKRKTQAAVSKKARSRFKNAGSKIKVINTLSKFSTQSAGRGAGIERSKYAAEEKPDEEKSPENRIRSSAIRSSAIRSSAIRSSAILGNKPKRKSILSSTPPRITNKWDASRRNFNASAAIDQAAASAILSMSESITITVDSFIEIMADDDFCQQLLNETVNIFKKILYAGINNPKAEWDDNNKSSQQLSILATVGKSLSSLGSMLSMSPMKSITASESPPSKSVRRIYTEN